MEKVYYDLIYLAACGINGHRPNVDVLGEPDVEKLYVKSAALFMDALVGTALKKAGISIPGYWDEHISKAVRKVILFDAERTKLFSFMEQKGIWYLPLKGIILKDYYPALGLRQMSDNDILFDCQFCNEVQAYMESEGYEAESVGIGNHDVYKKAPVYNFELHNALYSELYNADWAEYYKNLKNRLIANEGTSYGYHFTDEDFYIYITTHAYKHYDLNGTGLRTLLDFYVYLKAKPELDFTYIEKECEVLEIEEFEKCNRRLCKKVFGENALNGWEALEQSLAEDEKEMLLYYLSSGVYGTVERGAENRVRKFREKSGSKSKVKYFFSRLFPGKDTYMYYPFLCKHKWLLPFGWLYRLYKLLLDKERKGNIRREIEVVKKMK